MEYFFWVRTLSPSMRGTNGHWQRIERAGDLEWSSRSQRRERRGHTDRCQTSVASAQIDYIRSRCRTHSLAVSVSRAIRNQRERLSVERSERRRLRRKVVHKCSIRSLNHRRVTLTVAPDVHRDRDLRRDSASR